MKKIYILFILMNLLSYQNIFAESGTCGANVRYTISRNTISFSKVFSVSEAVYTSDCTDVFRDNSAISKVVITETISLPQDSSGLFQYCSYVQEMDLNQFDTSNVLTMSHMFNFYRFLYLTETSLTKLAVSNWNTSNVTDMSDMFHNCLLLTSLDVSKWDTSNVTDMSHMFDYCIRLTSLDVSKWITSNVTDMEFMFLSCDSLTSLDVSKWDTSKVTDMLGMFYACNSLTILDVSNWNTSNVTNMSSLFNGCKSLTSLNVSNWDTSNVTNMAGMFEKCSSLTFLDVGKWDTFNVLSIGGMFQDCISLKNLDVSNWNTFNVKYMSYMFYGCILLSEVDMSKWNTSNVTNMSFMFSECKSLTSLDMNKWNTSNVTNMNHMFSNCSLLIRLDLNKWNTSNVIDMGGMFDGCSSLKNIDVSKWNTSNVNYLFYMFAGCSSLISLDVSKWNTSNVTDMRSVFEDCINLTTLIFGKESLEKNIFRTLPNYNDTWYYYQAGEDAGKPLSIGTSRKYGSLFTAYNYNTMAGIWSTEQKPILEIKDSNIRGKNKEIQIVIPWSSDLMKVECELYNDQTGQKVNMNLKERMDSTGKNKVLSYVGSPLENGTVYRFKVRVYNGKWSNYVEKYAMPIANVYGATVVAGNKTMVINNQWRENTTGTRYMLCDADTEKEIAYKVGTKSNTTWTYSQLTNGKLYYVVAVPYRDYKGQRLWGPNQMRIYFLPMGIPGNGKVNFTNNTTAEISIGNDSAVDGIRVLYRTIGGALKNGCEAKGAKCTISGLNKNTAYEFYAMKYKMAQGKKYYSMGTLIPYKTALSGLKAPQNNPVVTMTNSGYTTFSIKKAAEADGISVLYREGEGAFQQACEKAGNSCSTTLSTTKNYTFYIMQYKVVSGKKLYSNGIVARDFSSGKSADTERLYTNFYLADESISQEEIAAALDDYLTEDAMLMTEAMEAMSEELLAKSAEEYEYEFIEDDDSWIEEYARFDSDVPVASSELKLEVTASQYEEQDISYPWSSLFYLDDGNAVNWSVPYFENK